LVPATTEQHAMLQLDLPPVLPAGIGGDLVETVELIDEFTNKKTGKTSNCYRIT